MRQRNCVNSSIDLLLMSLLPCVAVLCSAIIMYNVGAHFCVDITVTAAAGLVPPLTMLCLPVILIHQVARFLT